MDSQMTETTHCKNKTVPCTLCLLLHCLLSLVSSAWFVVCLFAVLSLCCTVLNALSHTQLEWITLQPLQQPQQEGQLFLVYHYFSYLYFIEGHTQKFPCRLLTTGLSYNLLRKITLVILIWYGHELCEVWRSKEGKNISPLQISPIKNKINFFFL